MTGEGKEGARLPRLNTPGRLLGCAALLWLGSIVLLFVPFGVLGCVPLAFVQVALLVRAVRMRSEGWPIHAVFHAVLIAMTAFPPAYLASLLLV